LVNRTYPGKYCILHFKKELLYLNKTIKQLIFTLMKTGNELLAQLRLNKTARI